MAEVQFNVTLEFDRKPLDKKLSAGQDYVDSECVRLMTPYVPVGLPYYRNSGALRDSVGIPEPGKIEYTAPLAEHDYYATVDHTHGGNPQAQRMWFDFMKHRHGAEIAKGLSEITGGEAKI